ncbi:MAG: STAS/SEC14 domain-containing protein [Pseudomonadota bacterium]|nr:MAG: STAS/SEC14 domain-containing protein [Pseudomonadota bacterium]
MPFAVSYTTDPVGLVATFTGEVTGEEIITHLNQIAERKDMVYRLGDMRAVTNVKVTLPELHKMAILECSVPQDFKLHKLALVGDRLKYRWFVDTYFFFVEVWIGKRRKYETKVFDNMEDAYEWLDIPQPVILDFKSS